MTPSSPKSYNGLDKRKCFFNEKNHLNDISPKFWTIQFLIHSIDRLTP